MHYSCILTSCILTLIIWFLLLWRVHCCISISTPENGLRNHHQWNIYSCIYTTCNATATFLKHSILKIFHYGEIKFHSFIPIVDMHTFKRVYTGILNILTEQSKADWSEYVEPDLDVLGLVPRPSLALKHQYVQHHKSLLNVLLVVSSSIYGTKYKTAWIC